MQSQDNRPLSVVKLKFFSKMIICFKGFRQTGGKTLSGKLDKRTRTSAEDYKAVLVIMQSTGQNVFMVHRVGGCPWFPGCCTHLLLLPSTLGSKLSMKIKVS